MRLILALQKYKKRAGVVFIPLLLLMGPDASFGCNLQSTSGDFTSVATRDGKNSNQWAPPGSDPNGGQARVRYVFECGINGEIRLKDKLGELPYRWLVDFPKALWFNSQVLIEVQYPSRVINNGGNIIQQGHCPFIYKMGVGDGIRKFGHDAGSSGVVGHYQCDGEQPLGVFRVRDISLNTLEEGEKMNVTVDLEAAYRVHSDNDRVYGITELLEDGDFVSTNNGTHGVLRLGLDTRADNCTNPKAYTVDHPKQEMVFRTLSIGAARDVNEEISFHIGLRYNGKAVNPESTKPYICNRNVAPKVTFTTTEGKYSDDKRYIKLDDVGLYLSLSRSRRNNVYEPITFGEAIDISPWLVGWPDRFGWTIFKAKLTRDPSTPLKTGRFTQTIQGVFEYD